MKLNLGCGAMPYNGYINIDYFIESVDTNYPGYRQTVASDCIIIKEDVRSLPYAANSVDEILAYHILEHFSFRETIPILIHWFNLLKSGGVLKLEVPDLVYLLEEWKKDPIENRFFYSIWSQHIHKGDYHLTGFSEPLLRNYLDEAGIKNYVLRSIPSHGIICLNVEAVK